MGDQSAAAIPVVLVVEDDDDTRTTLAWVLDACGFRTAEARTGADALRLARDNPDVVVLDVGLPDGDGRAVVRQLKADPATAHLPVLILSGRAAGPADLAAGLEDGADAYLTKPAEPLVLVAHLRALLRVRRAEDDLRLRDRAVRAVPHGLVITDPARPDNPIVYATPGFERLTGYPVPEAVGRNCRFLQGPDTDPEAVAEVHRALAAGRECEVELINYRKDGTPFWNRLTVSPVREGDRVTHFVGVQQDVTARRKLEDQLRQAQKMEAVGRLAGGIAHDFNNLLTVINGYGELILAALPAAHPARGLVDEVTRAGGRAAALTRQLLAFSRQTVLEPRVLDPNHVIQDLERMLHRLLGEDVELVCRLTPAVGRVRVDPGQLEQALVNLCVNARDAMPTGGTLTIETLDVVLGEGAAAGPGRYVRVTIADTGHGMTEDVRRHIFEPFFTTKGPDKGTGLGLAMVFGFVRQSGGHITVRSEPGRGTTFELYLPRVDTAATDGPVAAGGPLPTGTETVLLVEDEAAVRTLGCHVLGRCGYVVLEAASGPEAVKVADQHRGPLHLLVTDVVMPGGLGGRQVAEAVVARHPRVRVLFTSGYTDDARLRHGAGGAGVHFLQKPFTPTELARKVRDVLDGATPP